eukprot:1648561-Pleurochrysis_carterae.AAC.1
MTHSFANSPPVLRLLCANPSARMQSVGWKTALLPSARRTGRRCCLALRMARHRPSHSQVANHWAAA